MAAPTRGVLGSSTSGISPGSISWPSGGLTSASVSGRTSPTGSLNTCSYIHESTAPRDPEKRSRGVCSVGNSSHGVLLSGRGQKTATCQGNHPLNRTLGALGVPTSLVAQTDAYSSRVSSVLRVGYLVEGGCTYASLSSYSGGLVETRLSSGDLQCRSMKGGLLDLPPLKRRLSDPAQGFSKRVKFIERNEGRVASPVMAVQRSGQDVAERRENINEAGDMQALEGKWHADLIQSSQSSDTEASWEQISMLFRVAYAIAMYGGLAFAGNVICNFTGVDLWGDFDLSPEVITTGFGYAVPPMMALLFILEDEIVKTWGPARAVRDVEDEELMDFFVGMSTWQFPFVVTAGAVAEELFFRVAVQGGLSHALQISNKGATETTAGLAALTGFVSLLNPFAQLFAAALTAALTGSMYYVISSPRDPKYVVAPVGRGRNNRHDIKQRVEAWYERRQQKKIYSPLMEGLLAMYLGFEWMNTGNILAPMITHTLYSLVIVGNGLRRIHDNRSKLRQRVSKVAGQRLARVVIGESSPEKVK